MPAKVIGIDLGTTNSVVAVMEGGEPTVIVNQEGARLTPSVVAIAKDGERLVGQVARRQAVTNPENTVFSIKRFMGRKFEEVSKEAARVPYKVVRAENGDAWVEVRGKKHSPPEISAMVLQKLKQAAEDYLGQKVADAVITVPAYFNDAQRQATKDAGKIAGLQVERIINEPTAAALAYGLGKSEAEKIAVYDLGGGTFDVTIIEIKAGNITVVATGGDHHLGGRNWDEAVIIYLAQRWQTETDSLEDPTEAPETLQDLWLKAEKAKWALTARNKTTAVVSHAGKTAKIILTRGKFDELTAGLLDRTVLFTKMTMEEAKLRGYEKFDKILLVGGSTKMPQIEERLEREFRLPIRLFEPDEAVARGAAIYGQKLLLSRQVHARAAEMSGIPVVAESTKEIAQPIIEQAQQDVAKTMGVTEAALEKLVKTSITNVTSHSFGIVVTVEQHTPHQREAIENLMLANDPLPAFRVQTFGILEDDQQVVELQVMENTQKALLIELSQDTQAVEIGKVILPLPTGLSAGSPIEVTFELDKQGRLHVIGREPNSNTKVEANFETRGGISKEELQVAKARATSITII